MKKLLSSMAIVLSSTIAFSQISFQITDGSKYLLGNSDLQVYYLYTSNGSDGSYYLELTLNQMIALTNLYVVAK